MSPRQDVAFLLLLLFCTSWFCLHEYDSGPAPFEDAAILMRYAEHLRDGHGLVWNVGEDPVEGATDFLFTLAVAGVARTGTAIETAVYWLALCSHVVTVAIIFLVVRRHTGGSLWWAAASAAFVAFGRGPSYVQMMFGTTFFAMWAALSWMIALRIATSHESSAAVLATFAVSGFILGVARPEGVLLAGFMLVAVIARRGWRECRRLVLLFGAVMGVLGGAYFLWRWHYFGFPLPNTFYKKTVPVTLESVRLSIEHTLHVLRPFLLLLPLGFRSVPVARDTLCILIPIVAFGSMWSVMSNEMNHNLRFQYALVPIMAMSWPLLIRGVQADLRLPRLRDLGTAQRSVVRLMAVTTAMAFVLVGAQQDYTPRWDRARVALAKELATRSDRGYTMVVTEAGVLPYYSRWRTIDAWGLNDESIAHSGEISPDRLRNERPELVVYNAYFSPLRPQRVPQYGWRGRWASMVDVLDAYVRENGYVLAAADGPTPYSSIQYWVRDDLPDARELVEIIRSNVEMDYAAYRRVDDRSPDRGSSQTR